jgi:SAM-dependent methyltransferase
LKGLITISTFEEYAPIYDSFYSKKNYKGECKNLLKIAESLSETLKLGLEIGAGTGAFTKELAQTFEQIEAFELSPSMTEICKRNLSGFKNVRVNQGDLAQTLESGLNAGKTDIVIANFHVFSYFTDEEAALFAEVCNKYLRSGGLVAFDFWDLEAVLISPPVEIVKSARYMDQQIKRKSIPVVKNNFSEITVDFEFYRFTELLFKETHHMFPRHLQEVINFFKKNFEFCGSYDLDSGEIYSQRTYGNLVFFRKF